MRHLKEIFIFVLFALFLSCEQQTTWDLQQAEPFIVVDAIITSEFKAQEISVYRSSSALNEPPTPILDATVRIFDGDNYHAFFPLGNSGLYISEPFAAAINKTYALLIACNNIKDTAYAEMTAITPFKNDTVIYKDGLYKFLYGGSDTPAMTEVTYNWSNAPEYCTTYGSCGAASTFYTLNSIDVAEEFGPSKQEIWFPQGTTIDRKKYALSNAHQDFIRSLLIETEWRGGLFDVEQGNVPTNFHHGTQGWFGVCMVISDSTKVN